MKTVWFLIFFNSMNAGNLQHIEFENKEDCEAVRAKIVRHTDASDYLGCMPVQREVRK